MSSARFLLACTVLFAATLTGSAMTHTRRGPTSPKLFSKKLTKPSKSFKSSKTVSQRGIGDERATEIQTALIKQAI